MKKETIYAYAMFTNGNNMSFEYDDYQLVDDMLHFFLNNNLNVVLIKENVNCIYVAESEIELTNKIPA